MDSEIIVKYRNGESARSLAREYGYAAQSVLAFLRKNNVSIRQSNEVVRKLSDTQETELCSLYLSGASMPVLRKIFKISLYTVSYILKKHNTQTRSALEAIRYKPVDVPKPPSQFFYYWLGLMLSDGWIYSRPNSNSNTLGLGMKDNVIIKYVRDIVSPGRTIYECNNFYRLLCPTNQNTIDFLAEWGCVHRKSLILSPTDNLINLDDKSFMQLLAGLIEGDGSIIDSKIRCTVLYSGSQDWCKFIIDKLGYGKIQRNHNIYRCYWHLKHNKRILESLLLSEHLILQRKWDIARRIMS